MDTRGQQLRHVLSKVPEVTAFFWIIKVLCTTVGETAADFLNVNLNIGLTGTSLIVGVLLTAALVWQFRTKAYVPSIYWSAVVLISVFGTLVTDNLTDSLGVPLEVSTVVFSGFLLATFWWWYRTEHTLSIHSIYTRRRETFYWLAILWTFALGTAAGDLLAEGLGLGYIVTGTIVAGAIVVIALGWRLGMQPVLAFWLIYILTRPLGASLGDFLTQPAKYGGLGFSVATISALFGVAILGIIVFLSRTKADSIKEEVLVAEARLAPSGNLAQVVFVLGIVAVLSVGGYFWQQSNIAAGVTEAEPSANSSTTGQAVVVLSKLGDMSVFAAIVGDMQTAATAGDLETVTSRAGDLEYEWDKAEAKLKAKDKAKWTEVDDAIDVVLRQARSTHPEVVKISSALAALKVTLE